MAFLLYFNTDAVGRTARFRSDVRRVMMASAIPRPHDSFPALSESPRSGNTARVVVFAFIPCEGSWLGVFDRVQYHPARTAAMTPDTTPTVTTVGLEILGRG